MWERCGEMSEIDESLPPLCLQRKLLESKALAETAEQRCEQAGSAWSTEKLGKAGGREAVNRGSSRSDKTAEITNP